MDREKPLKYCPVVGRTVLLLLLIIACDHCAAADVFGLFHDSTRNAVETYCDDLPQDSCDSQESSAKKSCLDPWIPRSCLDLPLMKSLAEDRGVTLPPAVGAGYVVTVLERNVAVSDIRIGLGTNPPQSLQRFSVEEFSTTSVNQIVRGDIWVLPCLNLYAVVGETRSKGNLVATIEQFPLPSSPTFDIPIAIQLDGLTYGGGGTLGIGTKKYFATLDANYTRTDFNQLASELTALVITPRFGAVINQPCYKGAVHVGAMYQDTKQTVDVIIDEPTLGQIRVEVDQFEPNPWNFLVGTLWVIDERLHAVVELGMGGRSYVISGLTVRF